MFESIISSVPFAVVLLILGFVFLVKGADFFVEGSSSIAKRLKVPSIIIGLTIVAMGTSLPEASVSITAAIEESNSLAVSNVVGSNIFNLMVVIGFCAIMTPVAVEKETLKRDFPFSVICALLLLGLGFWGMSLGRIDCAIFVVLFAVFIYTMVRSALNARKGGNTAVSEEEAEVEKVAVLPIWKCLLFVVIGIAGIAIGGTWVVDGATVVATAAGMSETLVGLTIVSIGTSLPELVTSVVAAHKKEVGMALGNAIGSNIFNILFVLGFAGVISPMTFIMENVIDIIILIVFSAIVWIMAWTKEKLTRLEGGIMVALYAVFMVYICIR